MGLPIRFPSADQLRQSRRSLALQLSDNCRSDLMRGYSVANMNKGNIVLTKDRHAVDGNAGDSEQQRQPAQTSFQKRTNPQACEHSPSAIIILGFRNSFGDERR